MRWLARLASMFVAVSIGLAIGMVAAHADTPNSVACKRLDHLAIHIVYGRHVPDVVLNMAKRHCNKANAAADEIVYSSYSTPMLSSPHPCNEVKKSPRARHEAECVISWLVFWDKVESAGADCTGLANARIDRDGLRTDLAALTISCVPKESEGIPTGWKIAGGIILAIVVISAIVGWIGGGGSSGSPPGYGEALQWRADRMAWIDKSIQRPYQ